MPAPLPPCAPCPVSWGSAPSWSPHFLPAPLPPPKEVINGNIKTVTEYRIDEDGSKFKVGRGGEGNPHGELQGWGAEGKG